MANKPISVTIKGDYTDKDVKRAIRDLQTLQKQGPATSKAMSHISKEFKAFAAGAVAAVGIGALTSQLKAMASAAAEDQQSIVALGKALQNVGLGSATREVEAFVSSLMMATGTSDTEIRNSFQTLATATGDVEKSMRLTKVAMDASAATGRDLATVSLAIAKASQGNVGALTRMGIPIDANIVKAKDFAAALRIMEDRFSGQAAAAADTYAGKMRRLETAVGEAQETIGYELLGTLDDLSEVLGGTDGTVDLIANFGENVANTIRPVRELAGVIGLVGDKLDDVMPDLELFGMDSYASTGLFAIKDRWLDLGRAIEITDAGVGAFAEHLSDAKARFIQLAIAAGIIDENLQLIGDEADSAATKIDRQTTAVDRLRASMDKLDGRRSIGRQRIQLKRMLAEGPTATGERTVMKDGKKVTERYVTKQDKRLFAYDVADARAGLGEDIFNQGNGSDGARRRAANQFRLGRGDIRDLGFGGGFARGTLATPDELRLTNGQSAAAQRYAGMGQTVVNIDKVIVTGETPAQVVENAKKWAREKALAAGRNGGARAALAG